MSLSLTLKPSAAVKSLCEQGASQTREMVLKALREAGARGLGEAQRLVPVRSGRLRDSLYARVDEPSLVLVLGSGLGYAAAVEYGTSRMEPRPYLTPAAEAGLATLRLLSFRL